MTAKVFNNLNKCETGRFFFFKKGVNILQGKAISLTRTDSVLSYLSANRLVSLTKGYTGGSQKTRAAHILIEVW